MREDMGRFMAEIRELAAAGSDLEDYLRERTAGLDPDAKAHFLETLARSFEPGGEAESAVTVGRLLTLVLGAGKAPTDLSTPELLDRLTVSLNLVFDALNRLVRLIHLTLYGDGNVEETIRRVIGDQLEGRENRSIEAYVGQISTAFLLSQEAFRAAHREAIGMILSELDPEKIAEKGGGGLRFGPLRKAESFDTFAETHRSFRDWVDSGRCLEEFQREFEMQCQKLGNRKKEVTL